MSQPEPTTVIEINFNISGQAVHTKLTVPTGAARPRVVLPLFQALTNMVVDDAEKKAIAKGKSISCKKGCGACCRQLVPISQTEAYNLAELIQNLPQPRRELVEARFTAAKGRLVAAGMLEKIRNLPESEIDEVGHRYFDLGIACPFLEDESCSIHPDRPLECREYLVTSPAANCAHPSPETIERVDLPGLLSRRVLHVGNTQAPDEAKWVPLVILPQWVAEHPEPAATMTGPEVVRQTLEQVLGGRQ